MNNLVDFLPASNASFNAITALCISLGYRAIKQQKIVLHKRFMVVAFISSSFFLAGYLSRYYLAGVTHFNGEGLWRTVYFSILISHTLLAIICLPMVLASFYWGLTNQLDKHRRWAKITFPIWLYVSLTGVVIYFLLFQIFA